MIVPECYLKRAAINSSSSADSVVERCRTDDLMPNVPISFLLPKPCGPRSSRTEGHHRLSSARRPTGLLQSAGGLSTVAMTRWWSSWLLT